MLMMERQKVETVICLNKQDLADPEETEEIQKIYGDCGYQVIATSMKEEKGLEQVEALLRRKDHRSGRPFRCGEILPDKWDPGRGTDGNRGDQPKIEAGQAYDPPFSADPCGGRHISCAIPPGSPLSMWEEMDKEELRHYFREFVP